MIISFHLYSDNYVRRNNQLDNEELLKQNQHLKEQVKDLWEENKRLNREIHEMREKHNPQVQINDEKQQINELERLRIEFEEAIKEAKETKENFIKLYNEVLLWKNSQ